MKPRAFVTRKVYPQAVAILQEDCVVDYRDTLEVADPETLRKKLQHADGVVCQLTDAMTDELMAAAREGGGAGAPGQVMPAAVRDPLLILQARYAAEGLSMPTGARLDAELQAVQRESGSVQGA